MPHPPAPRPPGSRGSPVEHGRGCFYLGCTETPNHGWEFQVTNETWGEVAVVIVACCAHFDGLMDGTLDVGVVGLPRVSSGGVQPGCIAG